MKKNIFVIFDVIAFLFIIYLAIVNYLGKTTAGFNFTTSEESYVVINSFLFIIIFYLIGYISGTLRSFSIGSKYKEQLTFFARRNEKLAQQNEIDSDDKEVLQRKIASLEIALNNALQNKDK